MQGKISALNMCKRQAIRERAKLRFKQKILFKRVSKISKTLKGEAEDMIGLP